MMHLLCIGCHASMGEKSFSLARGFATDIKFVICDRCNRYGEHEKALRICEALVGRGVSPLWYLKGSANTIGYLLVPRAREEQHRRHAFWRYLLRLKFSAVEIAKFFECNASTVSAGIRRLENRERERDERIATLTFENSKKSGGRHV